ncbi:MAG TPA: glycoside hydrolase family 32 protein [Candidatus Sulfotelmatobacter sp.]|nr:glycoside hydrolase family 32 protein [Candidatus Sulfotelmatobacter sp.]
MPLTRRSFLKVSAGAAVTSIGLEAMTDPSSDGTCQKLAADPLRPQYHLLPAHNWMNDPNGPIFYRGRYHMFHQYNPQGATWGNMNWAHATSPDMIHWRHEPVALSPTPGGPDQDGVFSGSAVMHQGKPTLLYTGVQPPRSDSEATLRDGVHSWRETQCLAEAADDDLRTWKKAPQPVIASPPAGLEVTGFRDPCLWREDDRWMMVVGSGIRNKGGAILLYSSPDLRNWSYLHPLIEGSFSGKQSVNPVDTGDMWECPDFFSVGGKHVLLISTMGKVRWKVGTYAHQRFTSEREGVVDWGSYYAAKTMLDRDGNRILWGWIPETRPDAALIAAGWAGVMSLPRVISLSSQNDLQTEVSSAAKILRGTHTRVHGNEINTLRIHDLAAELNLQIQAKGGEFTLRLYSDNGDFASIVCSNRSGSRELSVDKIKAPIAGDVESPVDLHMFLDGSVLEICANETTFATARVYRVPSGVLRTKLEGNAEISSADLWPMKPISPNRLTDPICS